MTQVLHWVGIFVLSAEPNTVSFLWNAKSVVSSKKRCAGESGVHSERVQGWKNTAMLSK